MHILILSNPKSWYRRDLERDGARGEINLADKRRGFARAVHAVHAAVFPLDAQRAVVADVVERDDEVDKARGGVDLEELLLRSELCLESRHRVVDLVDQWQRPWRHRGRCRRISRRR